MPEVVINYWAVLVSAIVSYVLGAFWYSPALFGKQWMHCAGLTHESMEKHKNETTRSYILGFVSTLVMAYVLSHFVDYVKATTFIQGMQAGFWLWLGFIATVSLGGFLWEGKPFKLYLLNNAYHLIALLLMGGILAVWA